jgi:hypothetical protein
MKQRRLNDLPCLKDKESLTNIIKEEALPYLNCEVEDTAAGTEILVVLYNTFKLRACLSQEIDKKANIAFAAVDKITKSIAADKAKTTVTNAVDKAIVYKAIEVAAAAAVDKSIVDKAIEAAATAAVDKAIVDKDDKKDMEWENIALDEVSEDEDNEEDWAML